MEDPYGRPAMVPGVFYKDAWAALDWLERAFGFERSMVITGANGEFGHSEMTFAGGLIYVGTEWAEFVASPASVGGKNTQTIHVHVQAGIEAHCDRARSAGAVILQEPTDQFYGDRTYRARDFEGHVWTFSQSIRYVSREEAEQASGLKIDAEGWR